MINKHTPGPWVWNSMRTKLVGPNNEVVLQDGEGMWDLLATADNRQAEVNASLVAAAPDLLQVAQRFISEYEENEEDEWSREWQDLASVFRAAIAKATGGGK